MYNSIKIDENQRKQAYEKLNSYMEAHFSIYWQDKLKYVDFLKTIKINFSDKPAIRANLINSKVFINEDNENIIPLDKVYAQVPKSVQELILDNSESDIFKKSNIFRTLNSSFNQEIGASNSLYVIINSENIKYGDDNGASSTPDVGTEEDDSDNNSDDSSKSDAGDDTEGTASEETPENPESDNSNPDDSGLEPVGSDVEI